MALGGGQKRKGRPRIEKGSRPRRLSPASWNALHSTRPEPRMYFSRLESLPVELLEQVYFHALDNPDGRDLGIFGAYGRSVTVRDKLFWNSLLSLPRASPILGEKLSSIKVKTHLIKLAFFPSHFGVNHRACLSNPLLRSALLRMHWMDYDTWSAARAGRFDVSDMIDFNIPSRLLARPWEKTNLDLLRDLLIYGGKVELGSYADEVAHQGFQSAILRGELETIRFFALENWFGAPSLMEPRPPFDNVAFADANERQREREIPHLTIPVSSEHVKLAVRAGRCDKKVLATLLLALCKYGELTDHGLQKRLYSEVQELVHWAAKTAADSKISAGPLKELIVSEMTHCKGWPAISR